MLGLRNIVFKVELSRGRGLTSVVLGEFTSMLNVTYPVLKAPLNTRYRRDVRKRCAFEPHSSIHKCPHLSIKFYNTGRRVSIRGADRSTWEQS